MDRLNLIIEQKEKIKEKILLLEGQNSSQNNQTDLNQALLTLKHKKAQLQHQKLEQEKYRQMEQQYNQRKAQAEREKQLKRIQNQKRLIELEVGMKRLVLNGVQQKVKGINSQQLFLRAMLSKEGQNPSPLKMIGSKQSVKNEFEKYLSKQAIKKQKPKNDLYLLNEKRYQLFEKKEQLLVRQILLKQFLNDGNYEVLEQIDIMNCSQQQIENLILKYDINIEDYQHPVNSEQVLESLSKIEENIQINLKQRKKQIEIEKQTANRHYQQKITLKNWIKNFPNQELIKQIGKILDKTISDLVFEYEKRHFLLTRQQKEQKLEQLSKQYNKIIAQNQYYVMAEQFIDSIEQRIVSQILFQTAEEAVKMHEFAHQTTALSFNWLFSTSNYLEHLKNSQQKLKAIELNFKDNTTNIKYNKEVSKPIENLNFDSKESNVFQTEKLTQQLLNDINLLSGEEKYFSENAVEIKRQIIESVESNDFKFIDQGSLFLIEPRGIKLVSSKGDQFQTVVNFNRQLKNIENVKKINSIWLVQTPDKIYSFSMWNTEQLPAAIGERINSLCGHFSKIQIYPSFTVLGSLCSILIGFQKGQLLKYNFNRNRLSSVQTNKTHYVPLGVSIKTGNEAAFPLANQNVIQVTSKLAKQGDLIHQFRQFFDFHTHQIAGLCFYKDNIFVSVEKNLSCAVWRYDSNKGIRSYEPQYTFSLKCEYKTYKQSDNPRFQDLYPASAIPESGQQLYQKWMQNYSNLKLQIYNNPKKNSVYFKSPKWDNQKNQQPIWKMTYDVKSRKILKIFQIYYNSIDGKVQCKEVKIWRDYLLFLVEKEHVMRNDLKTIKIYAWSIDEKKLRTVAIEFDVFHEQKLFSFDIIENQIQKNDFPLVATISSGKILLFSMLSGQLLKDISEQSGCLKIKSYYFSEIKKGYFDNFYGITRSSVVQFIFKNKNSKQKKAEFSKLIQLIKKKYNNLL